MPLQSYQKPQGQMGLLEPLTGSDLAFVIAKGKI